MSCEYQQIHTPGAPGCLRGGVPGPPRAPSQVQPQEVHPAPTPGLPGAQEFSRLDYRGLAEHLTDHPDLCALIGLEGRPSLYDLPEGRPAAPGRRAHAEDVRRSAGAGAAGRHTQPACAPGGRRRHRHGVAPRQSLLHEAAGGREPRRRQDLRPLPEGRLRGRLRQPHDPLGGSGTRAGHRPGAVRPGLQSGGAPESRCCWPTPTSTRSGCTRRCARTACRRSSRRRGAGRPTSRRRADGGG